MMPFQITTVTNSLERQRAILDSSAPRVSNVLAISDSGPETPITDGGFIKGSLQTITVIGADDRRPRY